MNNFLRDVATRAATLHDSIARDVWPNGGQMECRVCGYTLPVSTQDISGYLKNGWPSHCGQGMHCAKNEAGGDA